MGVGDCYFNSFKSNSRGMAIFFNNTKTNVIVHNQISSIDGNLLALDLSLNKQRFTLVNIYGPSDRDTPGFFQQLESILEKLGNASYIISGDWNLILDKDLDMSNYSNINNPKARTEVLNLIDENNLVMFGAINIQVLNDILGGKKLHLNKVV